MAKDVTRTSTGSYDENQRAKLKRHLVALNRKIRSAIPPVSDSFQTQRVSISEVKEGYLDGKAIRRVIVILRSTGCSWALGDEGGCFMCGHLAGTSCGSRIPPEDLITQFRDEVARYDFLQHPMLCLYNSGSFLNENEIDSEVRSQILKTIVGIRGLKRLIIESRPEFITERVVEELEENLPGIDIEIGVGLETRHDNIRDLCLNKGITSDSFVKLGKMMRGRRLQLLAYVLLKPPFLTEREAISEACATIEFAFDIGFSIVSLEPVSVQDFTLTDYLHRAGYYRPPWIWSAIEVIKRTCELGFIRIGGFEFFPVPRLFSHNCEKCNEKSIRAVQSFNMRQSPDVFDSLACECQSEWEEDLKVHATDLETRISTILEAVSEENVLRRIQMGHISHGAISTVSTLFAVCSTPNL